MLALNGKIVLNGGTRSTPIDFEASKEQEKTVFINDKIYSESLGRYFRYDVGIHYKINRKKTTHSIMLDVQNVSNRLNLLYKYYNDNTGEISTVEQPGIFPIMNYRIQF